MQLIGTQIPLSSFIEVWSSVIVESLKLYQNYHLDYESATSSWSFELFLIRIIWWLTSLWLFFFLTWCRNIFYILCHCFDLGEECLHFWFTSWSSKKVLVCFPHKNISYSERCGQKQEQFSKWFQIQVMLAASPFELHILNFLLKYK